MMRRQITLLMAALFAVAALAATQIQDLTTKRAEEVTFSAKVAEALAAPVGGVATLTLDADYTADAAISVPVGTQLAIDGAGHTLTLGAETNFIIQDGITLKNLKIDATALTKPLIAMGDTTGTGSTTRCCSQVLTATPTSIRMHGSLRSLLQLRTVWSRNSLLLSWMPTSTPGLLMN